MPKRSRRSAHNRHASSPTCRRDRRVASGRCSRGSDVRDRRGRSRARSGSRSTSARGCRRSRSSGSATRRCASRATGSARRSSTRASTSRPRGSPPTWRRRRCARPVPASTPRWRSACWRRAARCRARRFARYAVFGELSLGGELRDSPGALAVAEGARRAGCARLIVPRSAGARGGARRRARDRRGRRPARGGGGARRRPTRRRCPAAQSAGGRAVQLPIWPTSAATRRRCWRSRSPPPAVTTC